jgi:hypothetical protein
MSFLPKGLGKEGIDVEETLIYRCRRHRHLYRQMDAGGE